MKSLLPILLVFAAMQLAAQPQGNEFLEFPTDPEEKVSLSKLINSPYPEVRPYISPDGKTLYFGRRNYPGNFAGTKDPQDIWYSTLDKNLEWSEPHRLDAPFNDKWANSVCNLSEDGKTVYLYNTYGKLHHPIVKSHMTKTGWSSPVPVVIEDYYNHSEYADFFVALGGKALIMAIKREQGSGDQDLHVSLLKDDGTYSIPVNMGTTLNTENADYAPFLTKDGTKLFFISSNRTGGLGSCDIYLSERLDDTWENWSQPENLGSEINTAGSESYFSISPDYQHMFVDSHTPGTADRDIKVISLPEKYKPRKFQALAMKPKGS